MSARPDLTTEELIRFCERECANAPWTVGTYYRAIAQRLRSDRPAVTPEMVERFRRALKPCDTACDAHLVQALEAALSVSSTERESPGEGNG